MKVVIVVVLCHCISSSLANPGWFSNVLNLNDDVKPIDDDVFAKAHSNAKTYVTDVKNYLTEQVDERDANLPTFTKGTLGSVATNLLGGVKKASKTTIHGIRNTASQLTKSVIATTANVGMSLLLNEFKLISSTTGVGQTLALPDIQTKGYGCELTASGGYFSSLSSMEKSGNIEVTILDAESILLEIPMKFNEMRVGYSKIQAKAFSLFGTSGSFSINIGKNGLIIRLRLGMDSTCAINLERVVITELDDITVQFEGLGTYGSMATEKLSNLLISYLRDVIAKQIQDAVDTNIRSALQHNTMICSKFIPT